MSDYDKQRYLNTLCTVRINYALHKLHTKYYHTKKFKNVAEYRMEKQCCKCVSFSKICFLKIHFTCQIIISNARK